MKKEKIDVFEGHGPEVKIRSKKMMMYLIIFAIVMLFAGLTSVVLVGGGTAYWVRAVPPAALWASNIIVVLSSVSMLLAVKKLRSGNQRAALSFTLITLLLGISFCFTQTMAWRNLAAKGFGVTVVHYENGMNRLRWNSLDQINAQYGKDYTIIYHGRTLTHDGNEFYDPADAVKTPVSPKFNEEFNMSGALICILIFLHIAHLLLGLVYLLANTIRTARGTINAQNWISLHTGGMYWHFMGILWLYLFFFLFFLY